MVSISQQANHSSLLRRLLLLMLAIAVGLEDFQSHFTVQYHHSHAYDPAVEHTHPEIFGLLAEDMETLPYPTSPDPKEHTHIVRFSQEVPSTESTTARFILAPSACRQGWRETHMAGLRRSGDPLFRPPC